MDIIRQRFRISAGEGVPPKPTIQYMVSQSLFSRFPADCATPAENATVDDTNSNIAGGALGAGRGERDDRVFLLFSLRDAVTHMYTIAYAYLSIS